MFMKYKLGYILIKMNDYFFVFGTPNKTVKLAFEL